MGSKKKDKSAERAQQAAQRAAEQRQAVEDKRRAEQELRMRQEQELAEINSASEVVNVEQGGMDLPDTVQEDIKRRKGGATTVSNQLGIR